MISMNALKKRGFRFLLIAALLLGLAGCSYFNDCSDRRRKLPWRSKATGGPSVTHSVDQVLPTWCKPSLAV